MASKPIGIHPGSNEAKQIAASIGVDHIEAAKSANLVLFLINHHDAGRQTTDEIDTYIGTPGLVGAMLAVGLLSVTRGTIAAAGGHSIDDWERRVVKAHQQSERRRLAQNCPVGVLARGEGTSGEVSIAVRKGRHGLFASVAVPGDAGVQLRPVTANLDHMSPAALADPQAVFDAWAHKAQTRRGDRPSIAIVARIAEVLGLEFTPLPPPKDRQIMGMAKAGRIPSDHAPDVVTATHTVPEEADAEPVTTAPQEAPQEPVAAVEEEPSAGAFETAERNYTFGDTLDEAQRNEAAGRIFAYCGSRDEARKLRDAVVAATLDSLPEGRCRAEYIMGALRVAFPDIPEGILSDAASLKGDGEGGYKVGCGWVCRRTLKEAPTLPSHRVPYTPEARADELAEKARQIAALEAAQSR